MLALYVLQSPAPPDPTRPLTSDLSEHLGLFFYEGIKSAMWLREAAQSLRDFKDFKVTQVGFISLQQCAAFTRLTKHTDMTPATTGFGKVLLVCLLNFTIQSEHTSLI